jgi:ElaA protein
MIWISKQFEHLTPHELYAILRLRSEVFVVEQNCVFQDMDNKDQHCFHIMGWRESALVNDFLLASARLVPPGIAYEYPSIGRVVSSPSIRDSGIGRELMDRSIEVLVQLYGVTPIRIGAQLYLRRFYESFDFIITGDVYDEDGIPHVEMTRK